MTSQTLAPSPTAGPSPLPQRQSPRWLMPVVIAVALVVSGAVNQAVTPFVRRDDYPFLVPSGTPGIGSAFEHARQDGRWLEVAWWWLVGQHGTETTASLTYLAAYALFAAGLWRVLHRAGIRPVPWVDALLGLAVFASAMWVRLVYWPGTLTPSVLVAAAGVWTLPWAAARTRRLVVWLVVVEVAAVLSYPPVGAVLLLATVVLLRDAPWRRLAVVVAVWLGGFVLGVGIAYTLNWLAFGHFGVVVPGWRHPRTLHSLYTLRVNTERWVRAAVDLWRPQWWALLVALAAVVVGLVDRSVRPRMLRLLAALVVVGGMDAAQTVVTGIVTEARGQLWTWTAVLLPVALALDSGRPLLGRVRGTHVATAGLAVLALGGLLVWRADVVAHQATRQQYAAIAAEAMRPAADGTRPTVVVYQDPKVRKTHRGSIMADSLRLAVRSVTGTMPRWCTPAECQRIAADAKKASVVRLGPSGGRPEVVAVVVPPVPDWL